MSTVTQTILYNSICFTMKAEAEAPAAAWAGLSAGLIELAQCSGGDA